MNNETISETDINASKEAIKSDDTDIALVAENRGNQLQQLNDTLQKDNSKLKAQFDEAVRIVKKVDDIHQKNISLSNELRDLKSEKEDLERRLQIALDINEELNVKMADQKAALHEQRKNDIAALQNELKNNEDQSKAMNDDFSLKICQIEEEKEKLSIELKIQQNTISRLVDSASHYFELTFESADKVITFLNQPPLKVNEARATFQVSSSSTAKDEEIEKIEKKGQRTLKKLNEANFLIAELKAEIAQSEKERKNVEMSYKKKISSLKAKIQQINDDNQMVEEDHNHQVLVLNQKIESLQETLKNVKEMQNQKNEKTTNNSNKVSEVQLIVQSKNIDNKSDNNNNESSESNKNPQIEAFEAEVDELKQKNKELETINKKQEKKINEMTEKNKKLEEQNETLHKEHYKAFNDLSALNLIHDSTVKEVETLRSIVHTKKPVEAQISKKKEKIETLKDEIFRLNEELKRKQKREDDETDQKEEQKINYQNQIIKYKQENDQLHSQIFELTEKVNNLKNDLVYNASSTNNSSTFSNNSNNNNNYVQKQSESELGIPVKIHQLQKNYKTKLDTIEKEKNEALTQKEMYEKQITDFITKLSSIVSSKPLQIDDQQELIDSITEMKKTNDTFKQQNLILSTIVNHMISTFHFSQSGDTSVLIPDIDNFQSEFERKRSLLKKRKLLIEKLQKVLSEKEETIEFLELKIKKFEDQESQFEESIHNYQQENQKLLRTIQSQESQIANFDRIQSEHETANSKHFNDALIEWKQKESTYREEISNLTMKADQLEIQNSSLNETNKQLKTKIHDQKAKLLSLKLQHDEMNKQFNEQKSSQDQFFQNERMSYEETITNLQKKLDEQRLDIEKVAKQLACSKEKMKKMKNCMKNAKEQQSIFQRSLSDQRSELEREKQLIIENSKAQALVVESEYASKLDERKSRWEIEKKKIFSYIADQFRQFFNPVEVIDEMSFKHVVSKVKEELIKLQSMEIEIRRLVGAQSHQRTEDAVAQIVFEQPDLY